MKKTILPVFQVLAFLITTILYAQQPAYTFVKKLSPSDGAANDRFGYSAHMYKNKVIVGAPRHDKDKLNNPVSDIGAAYIYERNAAGNWVENKISPSDGNSLDLFGTSVAISDSFAVVGSVWHDYYLSSSTTYTNIGAAYVFKKNATSGLWTQIQKLSPDVFSFGSTGNEWYGNSVSISGTIIAVGEPYGDFDSTGVYLQDAGLAYVYEYNASANKFDYKSLLYESSRNANDFFGINIQVDGVDVICGAPGNDYDAIETNMISGAGAAWAYERISSTSQWVQRTKLVAPGAYREVNAYLGSAVTVNMGTAVLGAPFQDGINFQNKSDQGGGFSYFKSGTNWFSSGSPQVFPSGQQEAGSNFGNALALWNGNLVAGSVLNDANSPASDYGNAFLLKGGSSSGNFNIQNSLSGYTINPRTANDQLGQSVGTYGYKLAVGSQYYDIDGIGNTTPDIGAVFIHCGQLTYIQQPANANICQGGSTSFSATAYFADSFQWYVSPNSGLTWTALSPSSFYSGTNTDVLNVSNALLSFNNYWYRCEIMNDCAVTPLLSNTATLTVAACTGITEITNENKLQLFPNPASETLNFISKENLDRVRIYNLLGETVMDHTAGNHSKELKINISALRAGTYLAEVKMDGGVVFRKFVVTN